MEQEHVRPVPELESEHRRLLEKVSVPLKRVPPETRST